MSTHPLADNRRQKPPEYNAAIRLMAQNQCSRDFTPWMSWVGSTRTGAGFLRNAAESYLEKRKEGSVLDVTPTWKEPTALFYSKAPAHESYNQFIRSLSDDQRALVADMLQHERDGAIHNLPFLRGG